MGTAARRMGLPALAAAAGAALALTGGALAANAPSGSNVTPTIQAGNPTCDQLVPGSAELKIDPPTSGSYSSVNGPLAIDITVHGVFFDFQVTDGHVVDAVFAKGGNQGGNLYDYRPDGTVSDTDLHAPETGNGGNGGYAGLSHILICYDPGKVPPTHPTPTPGPGPGPGQQPAQQLVAGDQAQQQVLGERVVRAGNAHLAGVSGCVTRRFKLHVRGSGIRSVSFKIDGKRVAKKAGTGSSLTIDPRHYGVGSHVVTARVIFDAATGTRPKTLKARFSRCRPAKPAFTG